MTVDAPTAPSCEYAVTLLAPRLSPQDESLVLVNSRVSRYEAVPGGHAPAGMRRYDVTVVARSAAQAFDTLHDLFGGTVVTFGLVVPYAFACR